MRPSTSSSSNAFSGAVTAASFLHEDLVFAEILPRLPAKSLMRFKCVSTTWRTRIAGDSFVDAHRRQHDDKPLALVLYRAYGVSKRKPECGKVRALSEDFSKATEVDVSYLDAVINEIVGSCNGLVCLTYHEFPSRVLLWNPATHQRRWLPSPAVAVPDENTIWTAGFGLDSTTGEYKVVLLSCVYGQSSLRTHVFAKGGTAWRGGMDSGIEGIPAVFGINQVAADGALHWKLNRGLWCELGSGVLSFDLSSETLRYADGPCEKKFEICRWKSSLAAFASEGNKNFYLKKASLSPGGGLHWSNIAKFTLRNMPDLRLRYVMDVRLRYVWRDQFVMVLFNRQDTMLRLVDPKVEGFEMSMEMLRKHGPFHRNSMPLICDYVETIISVF